MPRPPANRPPALRRAFPTLLLISVVLGTSGGADAGTSAAPTPTSVCDRLGPPEVVGTIETGALDELSGMGASRTLDGVVWAHADSGDTARLFAMDEQGRDLGTFDVVDGAGNQVTATDWEDIAVVRGPDGTGRIYVADIGDNAAARTGGVTLYRIAEPTTAPDGSDGTLTADAILTVHYPDGPADAETLLVDPLDETAVIVTKDVLGSSIVLTVPATAWVDGATTEVDAIVAGRLDLGLAELAGAGALDTEPLPGTLTTGGDVSPDGSLAVVRTYQALIVVERADGASLADALVGPHCVVAGPLEPQGEAVSFTADGAAILTASEVQRAVDAGDLPEGSTSPVTRLGIDPRSAPARPAPARPTRANRTPANPSHRRPTRHRRSCRSSRPHHRPRRRSRPRRPPARTRAPTTAARRTWWRRSALWWPRS